MPNDRDEKDYEQTEDTADRDQSAENESSEDNYARDESNRGERPDNLRQRSDWFQKRSGGK